MTTFIQDVIEKLQDQHDEFSDLTIVLPSKRAGLFMLKAISKVVSKTQFAPQILSIEEFVEELAQLKPVSNTSLLFQFYRIYLQQSVISEYDSFEKFMGWAHILLQDFNEIDSYLVNPSELFNYIEAIQDLEHWSMSDDQTPLMKNYLAFWKTFEPLYEDLRSFLISAGRGYQGLLYREAVNNLETYLQGHPDRKHVFVGFNAMNRAESMIIQELLEHDRAMIYWDIHKGFLENKKHNAGHFIRQYRADWNYFDRSAFEWSHDHFLNDKQIQVISATGNIGQAKHVGEIIRELMEQGEDLNRVAVILGDESLLVPLITSLPDVPALNITMGLQLRYLQLSGLYDAWFALQEDFKGKYYYKRIIQLLSHPTIHPLFDLGNENTADLIIKEIKERNITFISAKDLEDITAGHHDLINLLFDPWNNKVDLALDKIITLNFRVKDYLTNNLSEDRIALESLYRYHQLFNSIDTLRQEFPFIQSLKTLRNLFQELLKQEILNFKGEPLQGLQIMGMLESRVLDFDIVIMTSVNEGVLPIGNRERSFIPYSLKKSYELPTYMERDAIYAYHFFHSVQRANRIFLLYNSDTDGLDSGEKSRFITQLEIDGTHEIEYLVLNPEVPRMRSSLKSILKTPELLLQLKEKLESGISPSTLLQYIRNPIDFYARYVLGLDEAEQVEEVVESHTLGTVIHETLREIYEDFIGKYLTVESLKKAIELSPDLIHKYFKTFYKEGDLRYGKNLIVLEIAKQYVIRFLESEVDSIERGNRIKVTGVEQRIEIPVTLDGVSADVTLKGQVDRIDEFNGITRIIDYKTGSVKSSEVEIVNWNDLTTDYKASGKGFQILMYAYILNKSKMVPSEFEAGIISFKNLNSGFLKFAKKDRTGAHAKKDSLITKETLLQFEHELTTLIKEILDPTVSINEKEV